MGSELDPFCLNIGVTDAFFHEEGNLPDCSDLLNSLDKGLANRRAHILRSLVGILSVPEDLLGSRLFRILRTSGSVTWTSAKNGTEGPGGVIVGISLSRVSSLVWSANVC